ncbi:slr1658 superfamily regulator [Rhizobium sullae]|uniref:ATP-binding protein n=1 Tax=Rhizobium sullae TaxID=50338 RepID=A0A4R3Q328_RHISU|nr:ATP-binding protein [Rhizobium sullae]TCU15411.1 hypothetical protein EV132_107314 [Rhizobium sullae]
MTKVLYGQEHLASFDTTRAVQLRLLDGPLDLAWKHSSMTSDFIAEMIALRFRPSKRRYNQVRHDISYLTNELIENAIKFRASGEIAIEAVAEGDNFKMRVSNFVDRETAIKFQQLLSNITQGDPSDLLIQQIEASAATIGSGSGLGLLTLMSDYQADLAWLFEEDSPRNRAKLETYAAMPISPS